METVLKTMGKKSVIVQGEICPETQQVIDSIRSWFYGELILSTWDRGVRPVLSGVDRHIFLDDPGPGPVQNINRQVIGLKRAMEFTNSDVIFKTRSDMVHNRDMFELFRAQIGYEQKYAMFSNKVVISSVMTMNHDSPPEFRALSPSDWFYVGNKKDLEKYCGVLNEIDTYKDCGLCCEQLWLFCALLKFLDLGLAPSDIKNLPSELKWKILLNNFSIVNTNRTADALCFKYVGNRDDNPIYVSEEILDSKAKDIYGI